MYGYFIGSVEEICKDRIILEVNRIGYNIKVSEHTLSEVRRLSGDIKVYTYTSVKEDEISLYGFLNKEELELFKQLISVSGIGPKGGLSILSVMTVEELSSAIASGDAKRLSKAPGIGAKTAQRLILELKGKVDEVILTGLTSNTDTFDSQSEAVKEVIEALTSLGYSASDANRAVSLIENSNELTTEQLLKQALKYIYN